MSTEVNRTWAKGETWTVTVQCKKADGTPMTVESASWQMFNELGIALDLTDGDGLTISNGSDVTINVTLPRQDDVKKDVYDHHLHVVDEGGATSRQAFGTINVFHRGP